MTSIQSSILVVALLTQGVAVGLTYGILPVFLEPLEVAFDASRTQISSGQILMMLALTVGSITAGMFLDRGYARRVMLTGAILLILALAAASWAPNLGVLGSAAVMAGLAVPSIGPLAAASLITRTFDEDRGRAIGVMSMGPPLGSGLFAMLSGWLLLFFDWREVYLLFSAVALVTLVPIIMLVVPPRFEVATEAAEEGPKSADSPEGMGTLLRQPTFWWSAGIFALATGIASGWTVHVAAYLGGLGLDEAQSSSLLAVQYWMGVPGALVFGLLADRTSITTLFVVMLGSASAIFAGFAAGPTPLVVSGLCVVSGFVIGGVIPLYMLLLGQRMGPDSLGRAMGLSNLVMLPVMAGAVLLAASNFEAEGGYGFSLLVFSAGLLAAIGCLFASNWSLRTR
ncbi:MAG: MFS transporter [bacterium]|nr:MFS transporter [bacterium]